MESVGGGGGWVIVDTHTFVCAFAASFHHPPAHTLFPFVFVFQNSSDVLYVIFTVSSLRYFFFLYSLLAVIDITYISSQISDNVNSRV